MSLENTEVEELKVPCTPGTWKQFFFHLSKSQVFIYKIEDKVAPKDTHWEAVWHHVKSMTWESERSGSVPT